jgi:7-cyano-7-deazaguanine reductase
MTQTTEQFRYLGHAGSKPNRELDTFDNPGVSVVEFVSHELTSFCPVTHQPDIYTITIQYVPWLKCIESKSLKLYLNSFRDEAQFCEALAVRIADDLNQALAPVSLCVRLEQQVRGGLVLTATKEINHAD